jgi:hypothetical protein
MQSIEGKGRTEAFVHEATFLVKDKDDNNHFL